MVATVNTVWYANYGNGSSTGYYAVAQWALNTAYTVGNLIRQKTAPAVGSERVFVCITAGTSSNTTEPTWVVTKGAKTTDAGGPVYMECTGLPALNGDLTNTPLSSQNRSASQSLGNLITNNTQDHYFICTTAGSTGSGEPTYTTTTGGTTIDSGCTWTCLGAVGSFTTLWGSPHARIGNALATNWGQAGGNIVYVSAASAETQSSTMTWSAGGNGSAGPTSVICVSNSASKPPVAGDITTGATVTCNNASLSIGAILYLQGVAFSFTGTNAATCTFGGSSQVYMRFDNCSITWSNSGSTVGSIGSSGTSFPSVTYLTNTPITMSGNTGATWKIYGHFIWRNTTSSALTANTSAMFGFGQGADILCEGLDLSSATGLTSLVSTASAQAPHRIVFNRCKLPSGVPITAGVNNTYPGGPIVDAINCDTGGNTYYHQHAAFNGIYSSDTTVTRSGGSSDGTTSYTWAFNTTSSSCSWTWYFESMPIVIWNTTTGANRTVTLYGSWNNASLPTNAQIWMDVKYFGTSSSTLESSQSAGTATILTSGSNLASDTSSWSATARQNTHSYSLGNTISVPDNVGRVFFCTVAGTSAGSEPGGYASATDGSTVTDGGATFRTMTRFAISTTLSAPQPQEAGYFYVYIRTSLPSLSATGNTSCFWIDPLVVLS